MDKRPAPSSSAMPRRTGTAATRSARWVDVLPKRRSGRPVLELSLLEFSFASTKLLAALHHFVGGGPVFVGHPKSRESRDGLRRRDALHDALDFAGRPARKRLGNTSPPVVKGSPR